MRKDLIYFNDALNRFWEVEMTDRACRITEGENGTVGKIINETYKSERDCLKAVDDYAETKRREGFVEVGENFIKRYELPSDLKSAVNGQPRTIDTPHGPYTIATAENIRLISVVVNPAPAIACDGDTEPHADGEEEVKGWYCATAYSMIMPAEETSPAGLPGVLVWLPLPDVYGWWDAADHALFVFPDTRWSDIEKDLPRYLLGQTKDHAFPCIQCRINISDYFDFIPYNFFTRAQQILTMPEETRRQKAAQLLAQYELRLLRHPFCEALEDAFKGLVMIYHYFGQSHEGKIEYAKAAEWFDRSLLIIYQSPQFRVLFSDIFLQLSFCFLEMSKFDLAKEYINQYERYEASASDACEQIRKSINNIQKLYNDAVESYRKAIASGSEEYYQEAIRVTLQAIQVAPNDPVLHFNLACFFSMSNQPGKGLYHLEQAFKKGFRDRDKILEDDDLKNIRALKEFGDILARYF